MKKIYTFITIFIVILMVSTINIETVFASDFSKMRIVDVAQRNSPSNWKISTKLACQYSNIGDEKNGLRGTVLLYENALDNSYNASVSFRTSDDDGVGFVFGYINSNNYYQFIIKKDNNFARISRVVNGQNTIISEVQANYQKKTWQNLEILINNNKASFKLNDKFIVDSSFAQKGKVGISVVASVDICFRDFNVEDTENVSDKEIYIASMPELKTDINSNALVRTDRARIVYSIIRGMRHEILNPEVFENYGFDWNDVKVISEEKLQTYPFAKLIKSPNSPNVYYVHSPTKRKKLIPNSEIFLAYGNKWSDIITVSQMDLDSYSNIRVIKTKKSPIIYELENNTITAISGENEFYGNGYRWEEVVDVKDVELAYYTLNSVIVAGVEYGESIEDKSNSKYLSIKTIKKNKEITVPSGALITMMQVKLTAGLEQAVNIEGIDIARDTGISVIKEIVVTDNNNNYLGRAEMSDNSTTTTVSFVNKIFIAPNSSQIINVKALTESKNYYTYERLSIRSANSIATKADIQGIFPIVGDRFKTITGADIIGQLKAETVIVDNGLRSVSIGENDRLITKFKFSEIVGNEDVYLKKIKLAYVGSSYVKISNIDLVNQSNKVISTVEKVDSSGHIVFDFGNVAYKIKKKSSQTFSIRANIDDGAGGNIKFIIEKPTDILAKGASYVFELMPVNEDDFPLGLGVGNYANMVSINDVDVLTYKSNSSPTGDLVAGSDDQVLGVFDIRMNGRALTWNAITLQVLNTGGSVNLDGNLVIRNHKSKEVLGQIFAGSVATQPKIVYLNKPTNIGLNKTFAFDVVADIDSNATILDTYQVKISYMDFTIPEKNGSAYHFNYNCDGNILGIKKSGLTIASNSNYEDGLVSAGKSNVLIGSFIMQAGIAEDLIIESLNINEVSGYDTINYNEGYSKLKIKIGSKEYTKYENPASGPFSVSNDFIIKSGKTTVINVYVDTISAVDNDKLKLSINGVVARGKMSGSMVQKTGDNSQSFVTTFRQNRLLVSKNASMSNKTITADNSSQWIASFKFQNTGVENIKVNNFSLVETSDSDEVSYANGYFKLKATKGGTTTYPIAGGNKFNSFTIRAGTTQVVDVYVQPNSSTAGDKFSMILTDIKVDGGVEVNDESIVGQNIRVVAQE